MRLYFLATCQCRAKLHLCYQSPYTAHFTKVWISSDVHKDQLFNCNSASPTLMWDRSYFEQLGVYLSDRPLWAEHRCVCARLFKAPSKPATAAPLCEGRTGLITPKITHSYSSPFCNMEINGWSFIEPYLIFQPLMKWPVLCCFCLSVKKP